MILAAALWPLILVFVVQVIITCFALVDEPSFV